jgi:hypothetical protein
MDSKFLDAPKYLVGLAILFNEPSTHALLLESMSSPQHGIGVLFVEFGKFRMLMTLVSELS